MDDGRALFSFNISDGTKNTSVTLKFGDIVDYSVMGYSGSNIFVNGSAITKGVNVDLPNPSNNLSVLVTRINEASTDIVATYTDGVFTLTSNNPMEIVNIGSVDVVSALDLQ